jgi:predicted TPR repeat methyltransferase
MKGTVTLEIPYAQQLARQLDKSGLAQDAEQMYRLILASAPEELDTLHFLGLLCHQQGRLAEAEALIRRIIALQPDHADALNNLGNVLQGRNLDLEAEACYRKAIEFCPGHASAHSNLAVALAATERSEEAESFYRRACELAPESVEFRCNFGNFLLRSLKLDQAVLAYQQAIATDPRYHDAWNGLSQTLIRAGRSDLAEQVFKDWLRLNPGDQSVQYMIDACGGGGTPFRAPDAYIQGLFDHAAAGFDRHLEKLGYQAPGILCGALSALLPAPAGNLEILDAGCGTGLCGPLLRPYARSLTGVDLSCGMLTRAESRDIYDLLIASELTDYLERHPGSYDAIVCSDTLCYFGDLLPVFTASCGSLNPGGYFAFTLEAAPEEVATFRLNPNGRYVHNCASVQEALVSAGLSVSYYASDTLRNEGRSPVAGHLFVARKPVE